MGLSIDSQSWTKGIVGLNSLGLVLCSALLSTLFGLRLPTCQTSSTSRRSQSSPAVEMTGEDIKMSSMHQLFLPTHTEGWRIRLSYRLRVHLQMLHHLQTMKASSISWPLANYLYAASRNQTATMIAFSAVEVVPTHIPVTRRYVLTSIILLPT